jgi:hypothetical protein
MSVSYASVPILAFKEWNVDKFTFFFIVVYKNQKIKQNFFGGLSITLSSAFKNILIANISV